MRNQHFEVAPQVLVAHFQWLEIHLEDEGQDNPLFLSSAVVPTKNVRTKGDPSDQENNATLSAVVSSPVAGENASWMGL